MEDLLDAGDRVITLAIEHARRAALLDRASLIPVPRTVPERSARQYLDRARRLHQEFWESRAGPPRLA